MSRALSRRSWFQVLIASLIPIAFCRLTSATALAVPASDSPGIADINDAHSPNGDDQTTTSIYDAQGRLIQTIAPQGCIYTYHY